MRRRTLSPTTTHGACVLAGLAFASYRVWLLLAVAFLAGCALTLMVMNGRRLLHWSQDMIAIWKLDKQDRQRARLERLKRRTGIPY